MTEGLVRRWPERLVHRHAVTLEPDLASPGQARRTLRQVLSDADRMQWLGSAELACTELVGNAVLHAHTGVELLIEVYDDLLHVAVRDFSATLPVQRDYSTLATTGRGLALVAALASEYGISDAGPGGKTVWFTIDASHDVVSEELQLAAWEDIGWDLEGLDDVADDDGAEGSPLRPGQGAGPDHAVTLLGLPPTLWLAAREHHDGLIRELVLHLAEHGKPDVDVAAADRARALVSVAVWAAVQRAQAAGTAAPAVPAGHPSPLPWVPEPFDLALSVPADLTGAFAKLQDTLDAAERLASDGYLLARPGLPEIVAVRDWACEQIVAQLSGVAPSPWPGTADERFAADRRDSGRDSDRGSRRVTDRERDRDRLTSNVDLASVRESARGVVAADDANRIIEMSEPLARELGWEVADIVGRRIVALIPPRLREAHVAGFTRHLSSGESHIIGVPLVLPVLRADGTEVECRFLVEHVGSALGQGAHGFYLAWIEPTRTVT